MSNSVLRKAIATDTFYPEDFAKLDEFITLCFKGSKGPGETPGKKSENIRGILSPCDKYAISGPTAAWAWKSLAEASFPELFIFLTPALNTSKTSISNNDWMTPFGKVICDTKFAKQLIEEGINLDNANHSMESGIEVQLPFLQYTFRKKLAEIKIIPLLIGGENPKEIADKILRALKKTPRTIKLIISTNLTTYGPGYNYIPFELELDKKLEKLDKNLINLINTGTLNSEQNINWFGKNAILVAKHFLGKAELIHYTTSGRIKNEWKNVTSYGAIKFF